MIKTMSMTLIVVTVCVGSIFYMASPKTQTDALLVEQEQRIYVIQDEKTDLRCRMDQLVNFSKTSSTQASMLKTYTEQYAKLEQRENELTKLKLDTIKNEHKD